MKKIYVHLFKLISDIAEEAFLSDSTLTSEALMTRLEEKGFFSPGNRERIARQLVTAALGMAVSLDDGALPEAISSVFTDRDGWPLLMRMEGGEA